MEYVIAFNAAAKLIQFLAPQIEELVKKGEVTVDQQYEMHMAYADLKGKIEEHFNGPEWQA